jgi:uncharacterized protein
MTHKPPMRLQPHQIQTIQAAILQIAGPHATTWLYGSRLDDTRRGGDVDLLVQSTPPITLLQRARIKTQLERQLSLPVDILACGENGPLSPFVHIALSQSQRL